MMHTGEQREAICLLLAGAVRDASRAGRLIGCDELLAGLKTAGLFTTGEPQPPDMDNAVALRSPGGHTTRDAFAALPRPCVDGQLCAVGAGFTPARIFPPRLRPACVDRQPLAVGAGFTPARIFPLESTALPDMEALMAETLAAHPDLAALRSISGQTLYHAPALLSCTYASILDRRDSPVILIAEEIRRNSLEYPRPLPLEIFEESPFDLTPDRIEDSLKIMAASPEFQDITFTTTSTGAVYLFSSRYLERRYAAFLAERADVGLALNP